ncbi:MAG: hypothetical protein LC791_08410, partial [Acidobacteria bacterium]|nr:hypothetical protein [Acidobacteriota bacterium]
PLRLAGRVPLMGVVTHHVDIPPDVAALAIELNVTRGAVRVMALPSHTLTRNYFRNVYPAMTRTLVNGRYHLVLPRPTAGVWSISLGNDRIRAERDPALVSADEAEYTVSLRLLNAELRLAEGRQGRVVTAATNRGHRLREPVLQRSPAVLRTHESNTLASGMPRLIPMDVPEGTTTLGLNLRSERSTELYLYDCTTGECFVHDFAMPAATEQQLVVRNPKVGRWVAAVNVAPFPAALTTFVLEEVMATAEPQQVSSKTGERPSGTRWSETVDPGVRPSHPPGTTPVLWLELIDLASEREEAEFPWEQRPEWKLLDRPVALGSAVYRFP